MRLTLPQRGASSLSGVLTWEEVASSFLGLTFAFMASETTTSTMSRIRASSPWRMGTATNVAVPTEVARNEDRATRDVRRTRAAQVLRESSISDLAGGRRRKRPDTFQG